jgi:tryptophanyl-tRNA synthetase
MGALDQWVRLQNAAPATTQLFFSIADLHALTSDKFSTHLRLWKRQMLATLIAVGLNPERSTLFYQSSVVLKTLDPCSITPLLMAI